MVGHLAKANVGGKELFGIGKRKFPVNHKTGVINAEAKKNQINK